MVRKYKQRPTHQKHTRSYKKIYYRKYTSQNKINHTRKSGRTKDQAEQKIRQNKRSGRAEDQAAQKYKANQKIRLEKRQGTQKDAYVKRTQYQNACAVSTMLGIYPPRHLQGAAVAAAFGISVRCLIH